MRLKKFKQMKYILILSMILCNVCCFSQDSIKGWSLSGSVLNRNMGETDTVPLRFKALPQASSDSLTVGVITKHNVPDTVMCLVVVMDIETSKMDTTVLYSLKQLFKWQQKGDNTTKPHYYYNNIGYLDADKKPISKNIVVIKEIEWL